MIHHIIISVCINGLLKANKSSLCTIHIVVTENILLYIETMIIIVYVLLELEICLLSLYSLVVYQTLGLRVLAI